LFNNNGKINLFLVHTDSKEAKRSDANKGGHDVRRLKHSESELTEKKRREKEGGGGRGSESGTVGMEGGGVVAGRRPGDSSC
jgi:hypothetical protein